jgi:uncharacterized Zn finger protein (UPF0148 family)/chaperonin cofactor prefoldin
MKTFSRFYSHALKDIPILAYMFKEKSSKKRIVGNNSAKDNATLDARHQQKLVELTQHRNSLQDLYAQKSSIENELQESTERIQQLKSIGDFESSTYNNEWSSNILLQDAYTELLDKIEKVESGNDEIEYYENTGRILFKYYDVIENQECTIHKIAPPTQSKPSRKKHVVPIGRSILDAFAMTSNTSPHPKAEVDKSVLVDEYIAKVDPTYLHSHNDEGLGNCPTCQVTLLCIQHEGVMICPTCGYQDVLLVEQNRPLLRQITKESTASYKRINHFREWCSQIQGKESTDIPESVFEKILQEIKKEKIFDKQKITPIKMREILKRLRINKYYEHVNYIISRINGVATAPPHFSPELEDKLCSMFKEIQGPFLSAVMHTAKERKNFLSYAYCLHQFFRILNMPEYLKYTTLLKSREKLYVQDQIFKSICKELNWPFYPTL